jgi:hypothetical protein
MTADLISSTFLFKQNRLQYLLNTNSKSLLLKNVYVRGICSPIKTADVYRLHSSMNSSKHFIACFFSSEASVVNNRLTSCHTSGSTGRSGCIRLFLRFGRVDLTTASKFALQRISNYSSSLAKRVNVTTLHCSGHKHLAPL